MVASFHVRYCLFRRKLLFLLLVISDVEIPVVAFIALDIKGLMRRLMHWCGCRYNLSHKFDDELANEISTVYESGRTVAFLDPNVKAYFMSEKLANSMSRWLEVVYSKMVHPRDLMCRLLRSWVDWQCSIVTRYIQDGAVQRKYLRSQCIVDRISIFIELMFR